MTRPVVQVPAPPGDEALALIDELLYPWNTGRKVHPGYEGIDAGFERADAVADWNRRRAAIAASAPAPAGDARMDTYVRISDMPVRGHQALGFGFSMDVDEDGKPVGVEVLSALAVEIDGRAVVAGGAAPADLSVLSDRQVCGLGAAAFSRMADELEPMSAELARSARVWATGMRLGQPSFWGRPVRALLVAAGSVPADEPAGLRERLRQALGHDELPDDDGLIADVTEWIRLGRAFGVPVPAGHEEPEFTRSDIERVAAEWDRTADRIEPPGVVGPVLEQVRAGVYRACAVAVRHLVHVDAGGAAPTTGPAADDLTIWREVDDDGHSVWRWRHGGGGGRCPDGLACLATNHPGLSKYLGAGGSAPHQGARQ